MQRRILSVSLALWCATAAGHAGGNHRRCFPTEHPVAYQVIASPPVSPRFVVLTNFGILADVSPPAAARWICPTTYMPGASDDALDPSFKSLHALPDGAWFLLYTVGYWESRDAGCRFAYSPDPTLAHATVTDTASVEDPSLPTYAALSAPGAPPFGLFASTDAGQTWAPTSLQFYEYSLAIQGLQLSRDGTRLFLLTRTYDDRWFLYRGTGSAAEFVELPLSFLNRDAALVAVHPTEPNTLLLESNDTFTGECAFRTRLWQSDDGGDTFREIIVMLDDILADAFFEETGSIWLAWKNHGVMRIHPDGNFDTPLPGGSLCLYHDTNQVLSCSAADDLTLISAIDASTLEVRPWLTRRDIHGPQDCGDETGDPDFCGAAFATAQARWQLGADTPFTDGGGLGLRPRPLELADPAMRRERSLPLVVAQAQWVAAPPTGPSTPGRSPSPASNGQNGCTTAGFSSVGGLLTLTALLRRRRGQQMTRRPLRRSRA